MRNFKYKKELGYADPNEFLHLIETACSVKIDLNKLSGGDKVEILNFSLFLKRGAPIYMIGRDVFEKINHTNISNDIKYSDIKFPLNSCTFMLPNKKIITYSTTKGLEELYNGSSARYMNGNNIDDEWFFCSSRSEYRKDQSTLHCSFFLNSNLGFEADDHVLALDENKEILNDRLFCIKMIMLMTDRPDMIHKDVLLRKSKKGKPSLRKMRTIGSIAYVRKEESLGSHSSPSMHIRKGHFRKQPIGPRDGNDFKIIWLEPVMVNGDKI
jgi:hypothetical protein